MPEGKADCFKVEVALPLHAQLSTKEMDNEHVVPFGPLCGVTCPFHGSG